MDEESKKGIPADFFTSNRWNGDLTGAIWDEKRRIDFTVEILNTDCVLRPLGLKGTMYLAGKNGDCSHIPIIVDGQPFFDGSVLCFTFDVGESPLPDLVSIAGIFIVETIDNKVNQESNAVEVNHIRYFNGKSGFSLNGIITNDKFVVIYKENIILPNNEVKRRLEMFCDKIKKNIIVTSGTRKDNAKSRHFAGNAADIFAERMSLDDLALMALESKLWNGIGYYPGKDKGGHYEPHIHVDLRDGLLLWDDLGADQSRGYYRYGADSDFWRHKLP